MNSDPWSVFTKNQHGRLIGTPAKQERLPLCSIERSRGSGGKVENISPLSAPLPQSVVKSDEVEENNDDADDKIENNRVKFIDWKLKGKRARMAQIVKHHQDVAKELREASKAACEAQGRLWAAQHEERRYGRRVPKCLIEDYMAKQDALDKLTCESKIVKGVHPQGEQTPESGAQGMQHEKVQEHFFARHP